MLIEMNNLKSFSNVQNFISFVIGIFSSRFFEVNKDSFREGIPVPIICDGKSITVLERRRIKSRL